MILTIKETKYECDKKVCCKVQKYTNSGKGKFLVLVMQYFAEWFEHYNTADFYKDIDD